MENEKPQIRDMRNGDWLWINKLVLESPHLTNGAKVIYSALAYFANNTTQKAYPSIKKLSQLSSLNKSTVMNSIKQLEEFCFIEADKKKGKISQYTLLKLTDSQPVGKSNQSGKRTDQCKIGTGVVQNRDTNNTNTILNNTMPDKPADWDLLLEVDKILIDQKRHIQIIGIWIKEMKLKPENKDQMQSVIRRNLRPAKLLEGYKNLDIVETINILKNTHYLTKFTLETVGKYIDEIVANKKKQGPKILRYEEIRQPDKRIVVRPIYAKQNGNK